MNCDNNIAVVTGGSSGMGKACVDLLTEKGMKVINWDLQEPTSSKATLSISCDVSSAESVEKAMEETVEKIGVPRVCISCAGIAPAKRMVGREGPMPLENFQKVININLSGTFNVMRIVADAMSKVELHGGETERGVFINTASVAAYEGQIGQMAYSASKGGIVAMNLPAAREMAKFAIRVNTIAPGLIATPLLSNMPQEVQDSLAATVTFPKRLGKPEEFASLALHIIENEMINGEVIRLDGALRMQEK